MKTGKQRMICPFCGATLEANIKEEHFGQSIKCLRCKKTMPLSDFEFLPMEDEETRFDCETYKKSAGTLYVVGKDNLCYGLKIGNNIIGRNGEGSKADFKITTPGDRRMSREHIIIMVEKGVDGGYRHFAKLYKKEVNATYINKERIEADDCLILKDGYTIDLPGITLEFSED